MKKKFLTVICFLWSIQILLIACCPDSTNYYSRILDLEIENYNIQTNTTVSEIVAQDEFRIKLVISDETYAQVFDPYFLINSVYAAVDCYDIYNGLESDITEFSITCDKEILDANPGEPIDISKLNVYKNRFFNDADNRRKTIEEWLDIMNNGGYLLAYEWYFEFNERINSDEDLKFKIRIKQEDGTEFEFETNSIQIE